MMSVVPADKIAEFDRGAGAERLVAGGVGPVEIDAILQIDEPGEDQLRQRRLAMRGLLHDPEEHAIGFQHMAPMHQIEPMVELFVD